MPENTKVLIVGNGKFQIYELAFHHAFLELGYSQSFLFALNPYLEAQENEAGAPLLKLWYKFHDKYAFGPMIWKLNRDLIAYCKRLSPDLVFFYRNRHIFPSTIKKIKKSTRSVIFCYNNDDPFGQSYKKYFWRLYLRCLPFMDYVFSYRDKNIADYSKLGFTNVELLRSYYIRSLNFFISGRESLFPLLDVVGIMHYEDDKRDEYMVKLFRSGIRLKLYGPQWERSVHYQELITYNGPIELLGKDYNRVLNSAKIALVFLSTLNNDQYTRRCFEIPATKTMMLSVYTEELVEMFQEDVEAVYFRNADELISKVEYYLLHDDERERIAQAGYDRLHKDGHEASDRVKQVLSRYHEITGR